MIDSEDEARAWVGRLPGCDALALERLEWLCSELAQENERQNLVSRGTLPYIWQRHIADSAQLLGQVSRGTASWLDLGTGAGFPGLVIAILRPGMRMMLVESRKRRIEWLDRVCTTLALDRVEIAGMRLETVATEKFGAISARAFAPLDRLLELSARFSTNETLWLLPKGRGATQECESLHGWTHTFHVEQSLTDPEAGIIVGQLTGRKGKRA